ncbi:MAG: 2-dehydropantoate 2-reductase [Peptostreptococcaceae bacterium]|nr:2-dehydropantoate 2-reductase [Peptostreptococcaceae bacterium]
MKIAIVGAGAMGCLYGAKLSKVKSNQVFFLDVWQEHIDAINKNGLIMEENGTIVKYKGLIATNDPTSIGPVDLAIIFVKSTLTKEAMIKNYLIFGSDTTAITLQNGLGNIEIISDAIGSKNVLAGTTAHGATMINPGKMRHAGAGKTIIGELTGEITERIKQIESVFNEAGIETTVSDNVVGLVWDKLLINVGINALTGITRVENGRLLDYPEIEQLLELAVIEAMKVAESKGIKLSFTDPVSHTKDVCKATAVNKSSMLQDVIKGNKTEIEMINGAIVKEGKSMGIDTPVNLVLTNIIKFVQRYELQKENP